MKKTKRSQITLPELRQLLETGITLERVAAASGYGEPELSLFCKAWGIPRKCGPKPKPVNIVDTEQLAS